MACDLALKCHSLFKPKGLIFLNVGEVGKELSYRIIPATENVLGERDEHEVGKPEQLAPILAHPVLAPKIDTD